MADHLEAGQGGEWNFCHSTQQVTTCSMLPAIIAPAVERSAYDVDATSMLCERRGWTIHALKAGGEHVLAPGLVFSGKSRRSGVSLVMRGSRAGDVACASREACRGCRTDPGINVRLRGA